MSTHAHDRNKVVCVLERIAKGVPIIISAAAQVVSMQYPATFVDRFATTARASVAIVQAALLAAPMKMVAVGTAIMHRILSRGALHAKRLGLVPNADAVRVIRRSHLQGQFVTIAGATLAVVLWMLI